MLDGIWHERVVTPNAQAQRPPPQRLHNTENIDGGSLKRLCSASVISHATRHGAPTYRRDDGNPL
jgi:hypothetical protein